MTFIIGVILLFSASQLQAQENENNEIAFSFTINDLNDKPLTGMITASIEVARSGESLQLHNLFLGAGSVRATETLDIQPGNSGTIMITYHPAEEPRNIYANTPIVDSIEFVSNTVNFTLPDNKELLFNISFASKEIEVISATKTGASKTINNSNEVTSSVKAYGELEASAWIVTAKAGFEKENIETEVNTIIDTEMREDDKRIKYVVKVATGGLIIEQQ